MKESRKEEELEKRKEIEKRCFNAPLPQKSKCLQNTEHSEEIWKKSRMTLFR
jgi:hypothetical protein